ncbi:MAG: hypothetical protein AAFY56_13800, partial [Pseudomonadota bacterium]
MSSASISIVPLRRDWGLAFLAALVAHGLVLLTVSLPDLPDPSPPPSERGIELRMAPELSSSEAFLPEPQTLTEATALADVTRTAPIEKILEPTGVERQTVSPLAPTRVQSDRNQPAPISTAGAAPIESPSQQNPAIASSLPRQRADTADSVSSVAPAAIQRVLETSTTASLSSAAPSLLTALDPTEQISSPPVSARSERAAGATLEPVRLQSSISTDEELATSLLERQPPAPLRNQVAVESSIGIAFDTAETEIAELQAGASAATITATAPSSATAANPTSLAIPLGATANPPLGARRPATIGPTEAPTMASLSSQAAEAAAVEPANRATPSDDTANLSLGARRPVTIGPTGAPTTASLDRQAVEAAAMEPANRATPADNTANPASSA